MWSKHWCNHCIILKYVFFMSFWKGFFKRYAFLGMKQKSLNTLSEIYRNISSQVFNQSTLKGTSNLVWSHSYYDTALWEKFLKELWNDEDLITTTRNSKTPKVNVIVFMECLAISISFITIICPFYMLYQCKKTSYIF